MKKVKILGLIIVLGAPFLAQASRGAKGQANERVRVVLESINLGWSTTHYYADMNCKEQVQLKVKEIEEAVLDGTYGQTYYGGMDFACDEVTLRVVSKINGSTEVSIRNNFLFDRDYRTFAQVEVYCHPRPFSQSVLVVYTRNCINDPTPDCLTDEKKQLMDSLPKTRYIYDYSKSCLAGIQK